MVHLPTRSGAATLGYRSQGILDGLARAGHRVYVVHPDGAVSPGRNGRVATVGSVRDTPASRVIVYANSATLNQMIDLYEDPLVIYDLIDARSADSEGLAPERQRNRLDDPALIRRADVVLASSAALAEKYWVDRTDLILVPNGVADEDDMASGSRPPDLPSGKPLLGYVGPISHWLHFELLEMVARRRGDWNLAVVGPVDDRVRSQAGRLGALPNVFILGNRPREVLGAYLREFAVGLLPIVVNEGTIEMNPLRMYEYLLTGAPVVATPLPACLAEDSVATATGPEAFVEAIDRALSSRSPEQDDARRAVGRSAGWSVRLQPVIDLLESARRLTII